MEDQTDTFKLKIIITIACAVLAAGLITVFIWRPMPSSSPPSADAAPPYQVYKLSEFQHAIIGKSKAEVVAMLGTPLAVNSGIDPGTQTYDYSPSETYLGPVGFRVVDDTTGLEQRFVMIRFGVTGHVENFSY
jgi:hypothetical protein